MEESDIYRLLDAKGSYLQLNLMADTLWYLVY